MDPHQVLGVRPGATPHQVTRAFRREVLRGGHPDTGGDARAFRRLVAARDALLTPPSGPATPAPPSPQPRPQPQPPRAPHPAGPARPAPSSSDASALPLIVLLFLFFVAMPHVLLAIVLVLVP
ncbi:J domain-containing protein [Jiangella endophytica]|uniref:J domain-containing protein n=1 Tax=Jiangella endophytica TaxID=1623398 RepID=UPI000E343B00|nr:J domain-containing protein [Jiangella endophytica]